MKSEVNETLTRGASPTMMSHKNQTPVKRCARTLLWLLRTSIKMVTGQFKIKLELPPRCDEYSTATAAASSLYERKK